MTMGRPVGRAAEGAGQGVRCTSNKINEDWNVERVTIDGGDGGGGSGGAHMLGECICLHHPRKHAAGKVVVGEFRNA